MVSPVSYVVDYKHDSLVELVEGFEDKPLNLDLVNDFYSYDNSSNSVPSPFKRTIYVSKESISGPDNYRLLVTVEVEWLERGRTHTVEVSEYLYNWGTSYE